MSKKFLFLYTGGNPPKNEAEGKAVMAAWMAYYGKIGPSIVDGGAPFASETKLVGKASHANGKGYTIVQANSFDDAVKLTDGHPHVAHGGGIEIFEIAPMPGM
jgi:hypothetical protein